MFGGSPKKTNFVHGVSKKKITFGQFNPKKSFFTFSRLNHVIEKKSFSVNFVKKKIRSEGRRKKNSFVKIQTMPRQMINGRPLMLSVAPPLILFVWAFGHDSRHGIYKSTVGMAYQLFPSADVR